MLGFFTNDFFKGECMALSYNRIWEPLVCDKTSKGDRGREADIVQNPKIKLMRDGTTIFAALA